MADQGKHPGHGPIHSTYAGDPEMKELIELFLRELPTRIEAIRAALDAGDTSAITRLTQQLRGSSAGYGFPMLGSAAGVVEDRLRNLHQDAPRTLAGIRAEVDALVDMCRRACSA